MAQPRELEAPLLAEEDESACTVAPAHAKGFSNAVGSAFTVNYIMGCGFLGIPFAFSQSGLLLGPLCVASLGLALNTTKDFMLETSGRAEALCNLPARVAATLRQPARLAPADALLQPPPEDYLVTPGRSFEVADLFALFYGERARPLYAIALSCYLYTSLWAYATVFASGVAANVPVFFANHGRTCDVEQACSQAGHHCAGCFHSWLVWLGVFGLLAVPLACTELREQKAIQMAMFGARILVVLLMALTILAGFACDGLVFAPLGTDWPAWREAAPLARFAGLPTVLPIAIYAFIFHHSTPVLSQAVADKAALPRVFAAAFGIVGVAYIALGAILAAFFGRNGGLESQCNLNWRQYTGCLRPAAGREPRLEDRSLLASIISFVILIFPALDVLSAYPLSAMTLGNNLRSALEALSRAHPPPGPPSRWCRVRFRLLAAVPPLGAAALSTARGVNLGQIQRVTGTIGIAIALGIPSALRLRSYARHAAALSHVAAGVAALQAEAPEGLAEAEAEEAAQRLVAEGRMVPASLEELGRHQPCAVTPYTAWVLRLGPFDVVTLFASVFAAAGLLAANVAAA